MMAAAKERGLIAQLSPPQATNAQGGGSSETTMRPEWSSRALQVNLILCNATVWIMFVVAGVVMAFALLAMDELRHEYISFFRLVGPGKLILCLAMMILTAALAISKNLMTCGWGTSKHGIDITHSVGSYIPGPTSLQWLVLSV